MVHGGRADDQRRQRRWRTLLLWAGLVVLVSAGLQIAVLLPVTTGESALRAAGAAISGLGGLGMVLVMLRERRLAARRAASSTHEDDAERGS